MTSAFESCGISASRLVTVRRRSWAEEIYGVLEGEGKAVIDGKTVPLAAGDWVRVAPAAKRRFFAGENSPIKYVCIQVKANSLEQFTAADAEIG